MEYKVRSTSKRYKLSIDRKDDFADETAVEVGKSTYRVKIHEKNNAGEIRLISVNNKLISVKVQRRGDGLPSKIILNGTAYPVEIEKVESARFRPAAVPRKTEGKVNANLPGQIAKLFVSTGDKVRAGQALLILEAMKMENEITSPRDGVVHSISVKPEQLVSKGELLLEIGE